MASQNTPGKAKIIAFYNRKGGVGKTTLSGNYAAWLAKEGIKKKTRILYLDMDSQVNGTTTYLGIDKATVSKDPRNYPNLLNLVGIDIPELGIKIPKVADVKSLITKAPNFNLYTILTNIKIDMYWNKDVSLQDNYAALLDPFDQLRNYFEYIIIDLGPSQDYLTCAALTASDYIIFPVDCSKSSIDNMDIFFEEMYPLFTDINPNLKILGIVNNLYNRNKFSFYEDTLKPVAEKYGIYLFETRINNSTGLSDPNGNAIRNKSGLNRCVICFDRYVQKNYPAAFTDMHAFVLESIKRLNEIENQK